MIKIESLKKKEHFLLVLKNRIINNDFFSIYCKKNFIDNSKKNKLFISFVIKKKIGNAVKRNKAKRLMRELARKVLIKYGKINSYYVLIAKNSIFKSNFASLEIELKKMI